MQLQEKLETRKKQFHLLVSSIHMMQDLLNEDEEEVPAKAGNQPLLAMSSPGLHTGATQCPPKPQPAILARTNPPPGSQEAEDSVEVEPMED